VAVESQNMVAFIRRFTRPL